MPKSFPTTPIPLVVASSDSSLSDLSSDLVRTRALFSLVLLLPWNSIIQLLLHLGERNHGPTNIIYTLHWLCENAILTDGVVGHHLYTCLMVANAARKEPSLRWSDSAVTTSIFFLALRALRPLGGASRRNIGSTFPTRVMFVSSHVTVAHALIRRRGNELNSRHNNGRQRNGLVITLYDCWSKNVGKSGERKPFYFYSRRSSSATTETSLLAPGFATPPVYRLS